MDVLTLESCCQEFKEAVENYSLEDTDIERYGKAVLTAYRKSDYAKLDKNYLMFDDIIADEELDGTIDLTYPIKDTFGSRTKGDNFCEVIYILGREENPKNIQLNSDERFTKKDY